MNNALLNFYLLHYRQLQFLPPLLQEAKGFDPALVDFELRDDGSPPAVQAELRRMLGAHPELRATIFEQNKGILGMLEQCLHDTRAPYTYIGAGDDAVCPPIINKILGELGPGERPFIVTDFYTLDEKNKTMVYNEAMLPPEGRKRGRIVRGDFLRLVQEWRSRTYLTTHAVLCGTREFLAAGGYRPELKWHSDWLPVTVSALRSDVHYSPLPMACWRYAADTYSGLGMQSHEEVEVIKRMLLTLLEPQYADVRDDLMAPHLIPYVGDINWRMLRAVLPHPRLWRFLRFGHFRQAVCEWLAPKVDRKKWLGKWMRWTDFDPVCRMIPAWRSWVISSILRLTGAAVGRRVRYGKKFRVRHPGGLAIGDEVVFGDEVSLNALYPVTIGSSTVVEDGVHIESENMSKTSARPFLRRKSVVLGEGCRVGAKSIVGPGAAIEARQTVPAGSLVQKVEDQPLYAVNDAGQIWIDHTVLENYYGIRQDREMKP